MLFFTSSHIFLGHYAIFIMIHQQRRILQSLSLVLPGTTYISQVTLARAPLASCLSPSKLPKGSRPVCYFTPSRLIMSLYRRACCRVSSSSPAESRCCVFCPIKCYIHTPIHLMSHVLDVEKQMDKRNVKHQPSRRYRVEAYTVYIARYAGMHDDNQQE